MPSLECNTHSAARHRQVLAVLLVGAGLALAGCNRADDNSTVGQKVDAAIDSTKQAATDAKDQASSALSAAGAQVPAIQADAQQAGTAVKAAVDDASITVKVSAALAKDPDLSALKIGVDTEKGQVTLTGPAPSQAAKDRAADLAKAVDGVQQVRNQLVVQAG
ncbi:BON domain-containing protein [Xylophilus sp. GW821-FHT01B05]